LVEISIGFFVIKYVKPTSAFEKIRYFCSTNSL
jgi:hypothetical protein